MKKGVTVTRAAALALLCLLLPCLCGCARDPHRDTVMYFDEENTSYPEALRELLPAHEIRPTTESPFWFLEEGAAAEAFDTTALPALEHGVAEYWYPHYLATVVIAVDRDQTDAQIGGWSDLADTPDPVGYLDSTATALLSAMSYRLEGEDYTFDTAIRLLAELRKNGRLTRNSHETPVLLCFDYQAARLIQEGRRLEVIVPAEGTFSFERGLLSGEPLAFSGEVEAALLAAGLRLPDGRCDPSLYPADYGAAARAPDLDHYLALAQDVTRTMRREVWRSRLYTGADGREHQLLALGYLVLASVWMAWIVRRALQKSVRRGAIVAYALLVGWVIVRAVKYQTGFHMYWDRFLWFSYLGFQLMLTFTLLWMAWMIDRPEGPAPKWLYLIGAADLLLALLVLTNDLHNLVYIIDYSIPRWRDDYGYAFAFYAITAIYMIQFAAANVILLLKSIRNPNKKSFIFPLGLCVLIAVYCWGYINRIPFWRESDLAMVVGLFTLLFFESGIRAGLIPVNTGYDELFTHSPLGMQLLDQGGKPALASASAAALDSAALSHILADSGRPMPQDENTLLYSGAITGGYAVWTEDVGSLNRLQRETEESVKRLEAANSLLAEEEKLQRLRGEEAAMTQLMEQLEREIAAKTQELSHRIDTLPAAENQPLETARVALLLCYIKRRCNLFFRERETPLLPADELTVYVDELAELAEHANVKITAASKLQGEVPVRRATLLYDFFYEVTAWAAANECAYIVGQLGAEQERITMRLLPSGDIRSFGMEEGLAASVVAANGALLIKDLDDAVGISLSFPMGGGAGV